MVDQPPWTAVDWSDFERSVDLEGRTVRFVDYGSGPAWVLIHGMGGSWQTWLENIPALGMRHRVIALDLPGFGGSDPLAREAKFDEYPATVFAVLDRLGISDAVVVGHSFGGVVALALAARGPERVKAIVLASGGGGHLSGLRLRMIVAVFAVGRVLMAIPGVSAFMSLEPVLRTLLRIAVRVPHAVAPDLVRAMVPKKVGPGLTQALRLGVQGMSELDLAAVVSPTLAVWGREDRILPLPAGQALVEGLKLAELVVIDGVGHCAMFENPRLFNDLAERFVTTHVVTDETAPRTGISLRSNSRGSERRIDGDME